MKLRRHNYGLDSRPIHARMQTERRLVDTKTNEIPVARELFGDLDLAGRTVARTPGTRRLRPRANSSWTTAPTIY
ncbi:MAG: hypothetical protein HZA90_16550 [Verrucomicrobia bacterium]|nr:hypothetical protein [Verrucomicrobiota bacterium]